MLCITVCEEHQLSQAITIRRSPQIH